MLLFDNHDPEDRKMVFGTSKSVQSSERYNSWNVDGNLVRVPSTSTSYSSSTWSTNPLMLLMTPGGPSLVFGSCSLVRTVGHTIV